MCRPSGRSVEEMIIIMVLKLLWFIRRLGCHDEGQTLEMHRFGYIILW